LIYSLLVENLALKILEGRSPATKETFLSRIKNLGEAYRVSKYSSKPGNIFNPKTGKTKAPPNRKIVHTGIYGDIPTNTGNTVDPKTGKTVSGSVHANLQSVIAGNLNMINGLKSRVENDPSVVHVVKFEGQRGYGEKAKPTSFSLHVKHHQGEVKVFHKGDTSKPVELRATPNGIDVIGKGHVTHGRNGELYHHDTIK